MKINKLGAFIAVIVIVLGGALLASALGLFAVESEKEAAVIKMGEFAGLADPNDIRGSYSFADIEANFGVSPELMAKAFAIEGTAQEIAAYQCKGLEEKYIDAPEEVGTSSVRLFVAFFLGMPVELGSFLPESAVGVLLENGASLTPEREQYLKEHTIIIEDAASSTPETAVLPGTSEAIATKEPVNDEPKGPVTADTVPVKASAATTEKEEAPVATQPINKPVQAAATTDPAPTQTLTSLKEAEADAIAPAENKPVAEAPAVVATEEHISSKEVGTVKGSTTIFDIMSWGVKREDIGPAIGIQLPSDNGAKLKDLITEAGKSFEELKTVLEKLVDEAK